MEKAISPTQTNYSELSNSFKNPHCHFSALNNLGPASLKEMYKMIC